MIAPFAPRLTRDELRPSRALLTPLFAVALLTLAINDHFLKGGGLLPGWLTGKLSDFAGLVVLPVVLAVLLRVRSRLGLALCQITAVAFLAALKFSPAFSDGWTALVGLIGIPWHNTVDPTDMLAGLVVVPAWHALVPAMEKEHRAATPSRRFAETVMAGTASIVLMATSPAPCPNHTDAETVVPHAEAPRYPGDITGEEVLARVADGFTRTVDYTATDSLGHDPCNETRNRPATELTVSIDRGGAVTRHANVDVDESKPVEDCESPVDSTTITVDVPAVLQTADGRLQLADTLRITQPGSKDEGNNLSWTLDYWSDSDPERLNRLLADLGITDRGAFVGVKLRWDSTDAGTRGSVSLVRDDSYEECTVFAWAD